MLGVKASTSRTWSSRNLYPRHLQRSLVAKQQPTLPPNLPTYCLHESLHDDWKEQVCTDVDLNILFTNFIVLRKWLIYLLIDGIYVSLFYMENKSRMDFMT